MSTLQRIHFQTSRVLDFFSEKELVAQTGHEVSEWPLVILKELVDNALDACEDKGIPPEIEVSVDADTISVCDNGPGLPESVITGVLDFTKRVSSREAYVAPCRGAQGNALKTIVAMPFVLTGRGTVVIESQGVRHEISITVDRIRQEPRIDHEISPSDVLVGTRIEVDLPFLRTDDSPSSILDDAKDRFLQIASGYGWLNPHLKLSVQWCGDSLELNPTSTAWKKWLSSSPTAPHWYTLEEFQRLIGANIVHNDRLVREFVAEFHGLSGTAKQRRVLESAVMARTKLSELVDVNGEFDGIKIVSLLEAMKAESRAVKPSGLGAIGKDHIRSQCVAAGADQNSFRYKLVSGIGEDGKPWVAEIAFSYRPQASSRLIITGVNWSPAIRNPFRSLGKAGRSLDSLLEKQYAGEDEPIVLVLHLAKPGVQYSDRGKSAVIIGS